MLDYNQLLTCSLGILHEKLEHAISIFFFMKLQIIDEAAKIYNEEMVIYTSSYYDEENVCQWKSGMKIWWISRLNSRAYEYIKVNYKVETKNIASTRFQLILGHRI